MSFLPAEDRTCRMCGYVDVRNTNIYSQKDLYKKILALYPIILYQSDPLPKNICVKCFNMVAYRYDEYSRITKIQNKWIHNVRNNQSSNPYIKIIDKIDEVNNHLCRSLQHLSPNFNSDSFNLVRFNKNFPINITQPTIEAISTSQNDLSVFKTNLAFHQNSFLSRNVAKNFCQYCSLQFHNQKILAKHQLIHLNIQLFRCFDSKQLNKNLLNANLILINNVKCIRCTSCTKIFRNGSEILQHWRNLKCEYYCKLCGKEFPTSPKELTRHIKDEHNLDLKVYRNIKKSAIDLYKSQYQDDEGKPEINFNADDENEESNIKYNIPVLKLKRKADNDFDVKIMSDSEDNSNLEAFKTRTTPLLRVKNLSELQGPSNGTNDPDNFSTFTDIKINTVSFLQ